MAKPRVPEWANGRRSAYRWSEEVRRWELFCQDGVWRRSVYFTARRRPIWGQFLVEVFYADTWCMEVAP